MTGDGFASLSAAAVIRLLDLKPHPEGGHFRETFRDTLTDANGRAASTAIYFLLAAGEVSDWHRIDAVEIWHYHAGAPLVLTVSPDGHDAHARHLGPSLQSGQRPQLAVPAMAWQTATSLGNWTLAGCTVSPGFLFEKFELGPQGWRPQPRISR